ncbi:MAG: TetR/AcrR family transcriptional regulator [Streptosporangiaceae bacterium]
MSRRAEIADAAISTLARDGMRGLTHRAVDRAAGLPEGSASYYFRTRKALLQATVERLAELDSTDMPPGPGLPAPPGQDLDAFAAAAARIVESWLTTGRERQLARYELALEATRRPELRQALVASGATIRAMVADQFAAAGIRQPGQRAADFVAFLDGLLFDQIAGAGARELTSADLRAAIRALLAAVTGCRDDGAS